MTDNLAFAAQATGSALRLGWYLGLNRLVAWQTPPVPATAEQPSESPRKPIPSLRDLLADIGSLTRGMSALGFIRPPRGNPRHSATRSPAYASCSPICR
jgi:hypothetical protein